MGTKFTVYDSGTNPVKSMSSLEASNLRQELAAICYVSQFHLHTLTSFLACFRETDQIENFHFKQLEKRLVRLHFTLPLL